MDNTQLDGQSLYIEDENGPQRMVILFTFDSPDYGKQYVVYQDPEGDPDQVFASIYDDEGGLHPIEDDEEWAMVEEVIHTFAADEEES